MAAQLPESHLANLFIEFYSDTLVLCTLGKHRNKSRPFGRLFYFLGLFAMAKGSSNPRYGKRYAARDKLRKRVRYEGRPCALCGKPIDYSLTTWIDPKDGRTKPHPMSYELDEIVPISLGGSPFDYDNVQPTHRICNQRKGNKFGATRKNAPIDALPMPTSRAW